MNTVLITGVRGQTGSYLAEVFSTSGWEVHGTTVESDNHPNDAVYAMHKADLTNSSEITAVINDVRPNAIVNLAAISSVAQSWNEPELVGMTNGIAVSTILEAIRKGSASMQETCFVQASSAEIFGNPIDSPQNEGTTISPLNPYGVSKAYAHFMVQTYRTTGLRASNCILYNHESPRRPVNFVTRKITQGVAKIARGLQDSIQLGNLDSRRDWGWAPDYANALFKITTQSPGNDYIVATGVSHSVREFAASAFAAAGILDWEKYVTVDTSLMRPVDAPDLRGDTSRIQKELGWKPTKSFDEIVSEMVLADLLLLG